MSVNELYELRNRLAVEVFFFNEAHTNMDEAIFLADTVVANAHLEVK